MDDFTALEYLAYGLSRYTPLWQWIATVVIPWASGNFN